MRPRSGKARARSCGLLLLLFACAGVVFGQGTSGGQGLYRLSWPGKDWALDVSLAGFDVTIEDMFTDDKARGYWLFSTATDKDKRRALVLRIRLEPGAGQKTNTELRDFKLSKLKKDSGVVGLKTFEYKQIPVVRYKFEAPTGFGFSPEANPKMHNLEAFLVKDDIWITLMAFSLSVGKEDEGLFYKVLDSVKFTDTSNPLTSFDYFYKGRTYLLQGRQAQAAANFNLALSLEQKERRLDNTRRRILVGHLVDIYAAAGARARVRELLEYGISQDPTFPLFHLGLAHHYASEGDVAKTIAALEKAYQYRKNDRRTTFWIDPMKEPAFERFRKDETFRKAAKAMKR
ncbi:MAG TPA: hypothetical protein VF656_16050 [Pyrinomonadaceae bacterium]